MQKQTILVVGSGGREHALAWKLAQSPWCGKLYVAPGNGGTAEVAENVPVAPDDVQGLLQFAKDNQVDLTVVGMDDSLAAGLVNAFESAALRIFGPTKEAAQIEASKAFAKQLMAESNIPTAAFERFDNPEKALAYIRTQPMPLVVKASGLALGKGVIICRSQDEAERAVQAMMTEQVFGEAGKEIVIEQYLEGQEITIHALCDGRSSVLFPASQDYKQIGEGDTGPNTGGIGSIAPVPWVTAAAMKEVETGIVQPALNAMRTRNSEFKGCLYPGLMATADGLKVIEFNARFGDPEAEVYMSLLDSDLVELLNAAVDGRLSEFQVKWKPGFAACVVMTSGGYPDSYKKGLPIQGLDAAVQVPGVTVFHANTRRQDSSLLTNGGRVLSVTAVGATLEEALQQAYAGVAKIQFEGMYFRRDIGYRSLRR